MHIIYAVASEFFSCLVLNETFVKKNIVVFNFGKNVVVNLIFSCALFKNKSNMMSSILQPSGRIVLDYSHTFHISLLKCKVSGFHTKPYFLFFCRVIIKCQEVMTLLPFTIVTYTTQYRRPFFNGITIWLYLVTNTSGINRFLTRLSSKFQHVNTCILLEKLIQSSINIAMIVAIPWLKSWKKSTW